MSDPGNMGMSFIRDMKMPAGTTLWDIRKPDTIKNDDSSATSLLMSPNLFNATNALG